MKISVIVNGKGKIVAALIPTPARQAVGPYAADNLKLPDGHQMHQVSAPPELADAFLDGTFSEEFKHFEFLHEGRKAILKRAAR